MSIAQNYQQYHQELSDQGVTLVSVSKTKPIEDLMTAYEAGCRVFGENRVQELKDKYTDLPKDIDWHFIGHLQRNKVKYIAHFVKLIHAVDTLPLLKEINKQAHKNDRIIDCLLQVHIAQEHSKHGFDFEEIDQLLEGEEIASMQSVKIRGLMGMATFTEDSEAVLQEFEGLKSCYDRHSARSHFDILSMGMSGDYQIAIQCGSNMVRIGSSIFGKRD